MKITGNILNFRKYVNIGNNNHNVYRTRTISLSERTNQSSSNHHIPQSLEKLPLQETAI